jgi:hypothetical protein
VIHDPPEMEPTGCLGFVMAVVIGAALLAILIAVTR